MCFGFDPVLQDRKEARTFADSFSNSFMEHGTEHGSNSRKEVYGGGDILFPGPSPLPIH